jgi:membrane-bound lytic murein transglycosylase A
MHRFTLRGLVAPFAAIVLLAGCAMPPGGALQADHAGLTPVPYTKLPGWSVDAAVAGLPSFQRSCKVISVMPVDQTLGGSGAAGALGGKAGQWRAACAAAEAVPPDDAAAAQRFFETWLSPYAASGTTRITGYYEPVYPGSEIRERGYDVPIYGRPRNLVNANLSAFRDASGKRRIVGRLRYGTMVPYYTRAQIEGGEISRQAKVVAWVKNPVDAYMIQLQGAARLRLPDGTLIDLGFDGTNGRTYTPIGKLMVEKGYLKPDQVSITSIRAWLLAHPVEARGLMDANKNYVFFKRIRGVPDDLGTPGALDVPLAPEGSIAVDEKVIPLGAPVYVATKSFARLTTAQDIDVGAHGTSAAQIFFGIGNKAAARASAEDGTGHMFILLPRQPAATPPSAKGTSS